MKPDLSLTLRHMFAMSRQGFGKRKTHGRCTQAQEVASSLQVGTEGNGIRSAAPAVNSKEEASPTGPMELKLGTAESSYEAEDKELQKEAAAVTKAARTSVREAALDVRVAEAALRHERQLEEEREKRWWAAERRD